MLDEFNGQLKAFDGQVKELEDWLPEGRKRMDDLLNPDNPVSAEDRVVQTMELQVSVPISTTTQKRPTLTSRLIVGYSFANTTLLDLQ